MLGTIFASAGEHVTTVTAEHETAETIRQEHAGLIDLYRRTADAILSVGRVKVL